ncbi:MAG TPA: DUF418 domain-containing protein [Phycicoccus sp.]
MALPTYPAGRHRGASAAGPLVPHAPGGAHATARSSPPRAARAVGRLDGLDLARGLAVLSMLVAHLSPVGGPVNLTENLTAPLFAVVIGVSMGVRLTRRPTGPGAFVLDNVLRGLVLVVLGVALQALYGQIDVVLPYLGLLVIVLAPLALALHRAPLLAVGLGVAGAVLSPIAMDRAREELAAGSPGPTATTLVEWLAAGHSYRLTSLLPMALGGLALATLLPRAGEPPRGYGVAAVLLGSSLAAYLLGYASEAGARAYSGTTAEVVGATLLASGTVVVAFLLVEVARAPRVRALAAPVLAPVLATGRLALTAYTVQVLLLAGVGLLRGGAPDDGWGMLAAALVVVLGSCWALDRWWGTGPLEWVLWWLRSPWRPAGEPDRPTDRGTEHAVGARDHGDAADALSARSGGSR